MKALIKCPRNSDNRIVFPTDKSDPDNSCVVESVWGEQKLKECELFMFFFPLVFLIKAIHKELSVFFLRSSRGDAFI